MWIWFNWNHPIDTKYIGVSVGVGVSVDVDDSIELNFNWISN